MRFKVDENLPSEVADTLRGAGYDAATVVEQALAGQPDTRISAVCQEEERILVTLDTDFADIQAYPPSQYAGIMVLRLTRQDKPQILAVLSRVIPLLSREAIQHRLWIVEDKGIRIRG